MDFTVSVIIPAFNESASVGGLVTRVRNVLPAAEIIVVDDGSADATCTTAAGEGALVYRHPYNMGNGAAVKSGIRLATGDVLVFLDADGQHSPEDIPRLLEHFPVYDMVVGAREVRHHSSWQRAFGNLVYNRLASYVAKFEIRDLTSGFRAVKRELAGHFLYLLPNTYSYPTTLTLSVLRNGRSLRYVPIEVKRRASGGSNIRLLRDGVRFFMIIARICTLYSPFRVFLPVSFSMFLLGALNYLYTYISAGRFTNMSAMMFITSVIIFMMGLVSEQICQMRFERSEGDLPIPGRYVDACELPTDFPEMADDFQVPGEPDPDSARR